MKLVKLTTTAFLLCIFAFGMSSNAQAQIKNLKAQSNLASVAQVNANKVTAEFTVYQQGNTVHIVDLSEGPVSKRLWDMDDGSVKTDLVFFSHSYKEPGLHKICLHVEGPINTDVKCQPVIIK